MPGQGLGRVHRIYADYREEGYISKETGGRGRKRGERKEERRRGKEEKASML